MSGLAAPAIEAALAAARAEAEALGARVAIALVDGGGNLAGFLRMPGAFFVSSDLAIDKAWTAAGMGMTSRAVGELLEQAPRAVREGLLRRPRLTEVPGGLPLPDGGAIGVSGGSEIEDETIAQRGATAFVARIKEESGTWR